MHVFLLFADLFLKKLTLLKKYFRNNISVKQQKFVFVQTSPVNDKLSKISIEFLTKLLGLKVDFICSTVMNNDGYFFCRLVPFKDLQKKYKFA